MSQKVRNFLSHSWFPVLTIIGMAIHGYYTINYAQVEHSRAIIELRHSFSNLNHFGSVPLLQLQRDVRILAEDAKLSKELGIKLDIRLNRFERNQDRHSWVLDELAKKQGITPPKQLDYE